MIMLVKQVIIIPKIGIIRVARLTKEKLEAWRTEVAQAPKRVTIKVKGLEYTSKPSELKYEDMTEDQKRKRRDTANHILLLLKCALNHALKTGKIEQPKRGMWKDAEEFKGTKGVKNKIINEVEVKRLLAACKTQDFKNLVIAALFTGARYMELARLVVSDYNKINGTIFFGPFGKNKGLKRYVYLNDEGKKHFDKMVEGKGSTEAIFTRDCNRLKYTQEKRPGIKDRWVESDQSYFMRLACKDAEIEDFAFHGLRHCFASDLVNNGYPLSFVAEQLGHTSTAMVQKYYGHLMPSAIAKMMRERKTNILEND